MHIANLKYTTIADLNDFHDYTNFIFLEHQKSIMNGELEQAFFQYAWTPDLRILQFCYDFLTSILATPASNKVLSEGEWFLLSMGS